MNREEAKQQIAITIHDYLPNAGSVVNDLADTLVSYFDGYIEWEKPKDKFMNEPRPKLKLTGEDGNAFFIIGRALSTLKKAGASKEYIKQFEEEVTSGDYDHALQTCIMYFDVS